MTQPWLRQVEVIVGPLAEWRAAKYEDGPQPQQMIRLYGDGTSDNLRIRFQVQKHMVGTNTPSVIGIYNLSQGLRDQLRKRSAALVLRVGWMNTGLMQIFSGNTVAAYTHREGTDLVTNIAALPGYASRALQISLNFQSDVPLEAVVLAFGDGMKNLGITVDPKLLRLPDIRTSVRGWSFAGKVSTGLDKLAREYGFSWWIEDGTLRTKVDDVPPSPETKSGIRLSYRDGSLIRIDPMLAGPLQFVQGVTIESLLDPRIQPDEVLVVESANNPSLNHNYWAQTVNHSGDTHSDQWRTNVETIAIMGGGYGL